MPQLEGHASQVEARSVPVRLVGVGVGPRERRHVLRDAELDPVYMLVVWKHTLVAVEPLADVLVRQDDRLGMAARFCVHKNRLRPEGVVGVTMSIDDVLHRFVRDRSYLVHDAWAVELQTDIEEK